MAVETVVTGGYIFFISDKIILVVSVACNFLGNFTRRRREREREREILAAA